MGRNKEYAAAFERIKKVLEAEPKARERKNKNKAIAFILRTQLYPETLKDIDKEKVIAVVKHANTLDRAWRKVTEMHPELRGSDYSKKKVEEQEVQVALGYGDPPPPYHHTD